MKKIIIMFLTVLFVLTSSVMLSSCNTIDPGTMEDLVGTYKLSSYDISHMNDGKEGEEDLMEQNGIECYLVVTGNEFGYVLYKDNETEFECNQVKLEYVPDMEDTSLYAELGYTTNKNSGKDILREGISVNLRFLKKKKILHYTYRPIQWQNKSIEVKYQEDVEFKKVDKATDLSYLNTIVSSITVNTFDNYQYRNVYGFDQSNYDYSKYIYHYIDINPYTMQADEYYALKSDKQKVVQKNLSVTFNMEGDEITTITVGDATYRNYGGFSLEETYTYQDVETIDFLGIVRRPTLNKLDDIYNQYIASLEVE